MSTTSTPNIGSFIPLPQQLEVIRDVRTKYDYSKGVHEILLSGSVGSSKSLLLSHLCITHCLLYPGAVCGIGRLALPRLKETLALKIREHLHNSGVDHKYNETKGNFSLPGRSKMVAFSWADKNFQKFRSYELSAMAIEELSENKTDDAYREAFMRVGRLSHVPEKFMISASNPDSPSHWAYKRFIETKNSDRVHTYYSKTSDNPYLPDSYIDNLLETLDERQARRMVYGEWIEIKSDVVYYAYAKEHNYLDESYVVKQNADIHIAFDFNIGAGKPLSCALFQYHGGRFHFFNEVVVEGQRTEDAMDELYGRGLLDNNTMFVINGDATGKRRDTRSKKSDYDIIDNFLANVKVNGKQIRYRMDVARSNPPVRTRHNLVNGQMCNAKGERRVLVYKDCPTVDEGFRLTKLRDGAAYVEDDSFYAQHISSACGYGIVQKLSSMNRAPMGMVRR